ncbi:hypothetical protein TNCT_681141 [Trichonephila clavata]|uniref:Uncharacterized protein n=1 Tax=Trichonephila clavata TaxID=2740835 RepID=A0A8X6GFP0_TRICU|nr:hypothetical protein TNCT_681141 [Trichonephila clavata]
MIRSLVGRFDKLGSVADRRGRDSHRNIRTEDIGETVRQSVTADPSVSTRLCSSQLDWVPAMCYFDFKNWRIALFEKKN